MRGTDPGKYDGILREVSPVMSMHRIIRNRGLQGKELKFSFEIQYQVTPKRLQSQDYS